MPAQMLWGAHPTFRVPQLSSSRGWQLQFYLECILRPYIADFCRHGPLIHQVLLFNACLPKQ